MVWKTQALCAAVKPRTVIFSIMRARSALTGRCEGPEVTFWLTSTPPLPDTAQQQPKRKGASATKV